jgi:hypothetical protein
LVNIRPPASQKWKKLAIADVIQATMGLAAM